MEVNLDLGIDIPFELEREFQARLPYVSKKITTASFQAFKRNRVVVSFENCDANEIELLSKRLQKAAGELARGYRPSEPKVLSKNRHSDFVYREDPHPHLFNSGALIKFGPGRMALGPELDSVLGGLEAVIAEFATEFNAPRYRFPTLIGGDVLEKAGYLRSFPQLLTLACHFQEDLETLSRFSQSKRVVDGVLQVNAQDFAPLVTALSPAVCFHAYVSFAGRTLAEPLALTAVGKCFRFESSGLGGLERLWDFTMREIIFIATPEEVRARREISFARCAQLMKNLELSFEIKTATDPFFTSDFSIQTAFQNAFDLKFEVLADLPYCQKQLAVGSVNYHMDHFGKAFGITTTSGKPAHTGCMAWGLERLALALCAQHGPEPIRWPLDVKKFLRFA